MAQYFTDFRDEAVGPAPAAFSQVWGTGIALSIESGNDLADSDRRLLINNPTDSYLRNAIKWDVGTTSGITTVRLLVNVRPVNIFAGPVISGSGTISTRTGYVQWYRDSHLLRRYDSASETTIASETISAGTIAATRWLEMRRDGATIEVRHWAFADPRPATPNLTATDASPLPVAGFFGISSLTSTSGDDFSLYSIAVATDGDAVPTGPVSGGTTITADGVVVSQNSTISGAVYVARIATGALVAQNSSMSGTAHRRYTATGALVAQNSSMSGTVGDTPNRRANGALVAQNSAVAGTATRRIWATGALVCAPAALSGSALRTIRCSGALTTQDCRMQGTATLNGEAPELRRSSVNLNKTTTARQYR